MSGDGDADRIFGPGDVELDFRVSRRLKGSEEWFWYLFAAVTYIVAGIWHKWLLNWLIGPIWLITIVVVGPWLLDRARTMLQRRGAGVGRRTSSRCTPSRPTCRRR
jgi:hypothetical protein